VRAQLPGFVQINAACGHKVQRRDFHVNGAHCCVAISYASDQRVEIHRRLSDLERSKYLLFNALSREICHNALLLAMPRVSPGRPYLIKLGLSAALATMRIITLAVGMPSRSTCGIQYGIQMASILLEVSKHSLENAGLIWCRLSDSNR
jgi:hypothetical protein